MTELWRNGQRVQYLAKDDTYDYNTPVVHVWVKQKDNLDRMVYKDD